MDINEVRLMFQKYLFLENYDAVDVMLGVVMANYLPGDPVNLYIVGPSSSAKTELIRALSTYGKVFFLDEATTKSFFSGFHSQKGEGSWIQRLSKEGRTILAIKDLTPILQMEWSHRGELLSQIRVIMDGSYRKIFGFGSDATWQGKISIIAGVTPVIDRYHGVTQMLGERFLYYRMPDSDQQQVAKKAFSTTGDESNHRTEIINIVCQFLQNLEKEYGTFMLSQTLQERLFNIAIFLAKARTGISRDRSNKVVEFPPQSEGVGRLIRQFTMLAQGIAIVRGQDRIDPQIINLIAKLCWDNLPLWRSLHIRELWKISTPTTIDQVAGKIRQKYATARLILEDLYYLGLVDNVNEKYSLSPECVDLIQKAKLI